MIAVFDAAERNGIFWVFSAFEGKSISSFQCFLMQMTANPILTVSNISGVHIFTVTVCWFNIVNVGLLKEKKKGALFT